MEWAWNWLAVPFLLAAALDIALAWLIYRARPRRFQNRVLAVLLFVTGCADGIGSGVRLLARDPAVSYGLLMVMLIGLGFLYAAYLLFCSTLPTPLAAPLRPGWVRAAIAVFFLASAAYAVAYQPMSTEMQWADPPGVYFAVGDDHTTPGIMVFVTLITAYGILMATDAYRRASPGIERSQLRLVAASLATFWGFFALNGLVVFLLPVPSEAAAVFQFVGGGLATLTSATILGYAVLRTQVFDVDMRFKWTLSRTTLIAIFLGVFFVVAQIAQGWLQETQGYIVAGVATGALLLGLRPLERVADRIATAAIPHAGRLGPAERRHVYLEAAREAWADGALSQQERAMLERMRQALQLSGDEALRLEAEAARGA